MKVTFESTDNFETHVQVVTVLRLNQQERKEFFRYFEIFGQGDQADGYVTLPFYGMGSTMLNDFFETGEVTIDHWTDKDRHFTTDEEEISMLESMLCDDLAAVKRLAKVTSRRKPANYDWSKGIRE